MFLSIGIFRHRSTFLFPVTPSLNNLSNLNRFHSKSFVERQLFSPSTSTSSVCIDRLKPAYILADSLTEVPSVPARMKTTIPIDRKDSAPMITRYGRRIRLVVPHQV
ncbi:hypothetical protein AVEN_37147-1 [Araneus ventricosus]|uniref:Uncharacterized protein n=1 Tax=Araneus ventricosus TaxID=182803 RepID=A0A4Y2HB52_ARAVE|nr:hypothetical protein AVEN_37147-1 [Araneus ventricosus]